MTCVTCHNGKVGTRLRLGSAARGCQLLERGGGAQELQVGVVAGGSPDRRRRAGCSCIRWTREAGGDAFHGGGKHWQSQTDPEWQILASWVHGGRGRATARAPQPCRAGTAVRIIQTNAAGDGAHLIDPKTNLVTNVLKGVEIPHGVTRLTRRRAAVPDQRSAPHSRRRRRRDTGGRRHPAQRPAEQRQHHEGWPEGLRGNPLGAGCARRHRHGGAEERQDGADQGRHPQRLCHPRLPVGAVAGSIPARTISIVDTATDTLARTIPMSAGIRPMAFITNPDGSTKTIVVPALGLPRLCDGGLRHREGGRRRNRASRHRG